MGGRQGAECNQRLLTGNFCWLSGKKREGKKGKGGNGEVKKENCKKEKRKVENWKWVTQWGEDFFHFLFILLFIYLFFAFHFSKRLKFVLGRQNGNFLPGKSFHARKKISKNDFAPSEKLSCNTPVNSGITGRGGAEFPKTFFTRKFLLTYQEKRGKEERGKKGKWRGKEGKLVREEVDNWK